MVLGDWFSQLRMLQIEFFRLDKICLMLVLISFPFFFIISWTAFRVRGINKALEWINWVMQVSTSSFMLCKMYECGDTLRISMRDKIIGDWVLCDARLLIFCWSFWAGTGWKTWAKILRLFVRLLSGLVNFDVGLRDWLWMGALLLRIWFDTETSICAESEN